MSVVLIGAGAWGKNIARTLHQLGALDSIVETDSPRRAQLAAEYPGIHVVESLDAALTLKRSAAAAIATPVPTHFAAAKAAMEKGLDVFVEKPLTIDVEEAEGLERIARERSRILMVGHLLVHQPAVQWMVKYLRDGHLGRLYSLHQERLNLGRARAVENVLWSFGVHDVAVLLSFLNTSPVTSVTFGQSALQANVEDDVYFHCEFSGGVMAHLHVSWLWPVRSRKLTVIAEKGMLVFDEIAGTVTLHRKSIDAQLKNVDGGEELVFKQTEEPLKLELQHFLDRVRDRATPLTDGRNGVDVVRLLAQATRQLNAHSGGGVSFAKKEKVNGNDLQQTL